jgi:hypothetical protein
MLVYAHVPTSLLTLRYDGREELVAIMKNKPGYEEMREEIRAHGILDPCMACQYPDRIEMETGHQRLLIAREQNISSMECFIYNKFGAKIHVPGQVVIEDRSQLISYFRNDRVAAYLDICGYLDSGVITLETEHLSA